MTIQTPKTYADLHDCEYINVGVYLGKTYKAIAVHQDDYCNLGRKFTKPLLLWCKISQEFKIVKSNHDEYLEALHRDFQLETILQRSLLGQ